MWMRARSEDVAFVHLSLERRSAGFLQREFRDWEFDRGDLVAEAGSMKR
jgi:hypothetical protein